MLLGDEERALGRRAAAEAAYRRALAAAKDDELRAEIEGKLASLTSRGARPRDKR
jgi:predicted RNA polymerase sigma factor